jgi:adenylate cyclase
MSGGILLVDDTPANIRLLEAILTTHGHSVRSAASGPAALEVIMGDSPPDLVLLDIQMAGMNGYEVCRRIRENEATAMLPVIMVTASGNEEKVAALESGADDFIPRPFDRSELLARVRSLLRIKAYHDTVVGQAAELTAWNRLLEDQVNEQVEEVQRLQRLRRFLSASVAEAVLSSGDESLLQPHRREIALIFCDLRGFSHFSASSEPEEVLSALQGYHGLVGEVVRRYAATVGYFAGDGVMMFFNDPFPCPDPALRAVTAAAELRNAMVSFASQWHDRGHELSIGTGIAFGFTTLGLIGFEGRYEYTAIGPVVNLASRLCDEAGPGEILLSQREYAVVAHQVDAAERGQLALRGIEGLTQVWSLRGIRERTTPIEPIAEHDAEQNRPDAEVAKTPDSAAGLEFRVLGPVEVSIDGRTVALRAAKVRELLSLLLLHRGRVISVDRLAEELWEGNPPAAATAALRVYVSRLRKLLSVAEEEALLVTHPSAYELDVPDEAIDVVQFELLAEQGRAALADGRPEDAVTLLRRALGLWRGVAYAEVASSSAAEVESIRLEECRLEALEECLEAELARGNHRHVLGELQAIVVAHPLRERLWALRMIALYRSGRQPEALAVYHEYRKHLGDELGLDPSPALAELHEAILNRAADLEPSR